MEKNSIFAECNPIYEEDGPRGWATEYDESQIVLNFGYFFSDINSLLRRSDFSSKLRKKVKGWSLSDLVCSALWYT